MQRYTAIVLSLSAVLLCTGVVLAASGLSIDWNVMAGGGGHTEAGIYTLDDTIGQALAGSDTVGNSELCTGYWCLSLEGSTIYLPIVFR